MEKFLQKLTVVREALTTLQNAIEYQKEHKTSDSETLLVIRDSLIQRFEYNVDLLWKLLKIYIEDVVKVNIALNAPTAVIRESVTIRIISEEEGKTMLDMVKDRNQSSHIYHEQIAHNIAQNIPEYYKLMVHIVEKLSNTIAN